MTIYLDFDGTLVEHTYPSIGRCNFGCIEVVKKLQDAGHTILLNTMRCEFDDGSLEEAQRWLGNAYMHLKDRKVAMEGNFDLEPIKSTDHKHSPAYWNWEFFRDNDFIIIDDQTRDIPLKRCVMSSGGMVDWDAIDREFEENGIYNKEIEIEIQCVTD